MIVRLAKPSDLKTIQDLNHAEFMQLEAAIKNANPVITIDAWRELLD